MKCKKRRTILDFFKYLSCEKCVMNNSNHEILIGNNRLCFYYLKVCEMMIFDNDTLFMFSKTVKLFLKDAIINQNEILTLIIDKREIKSIYDFENLIDFELDIHILMI